MRKAVSKRGSARVARGFQMTDQLAPSGEQTKAAFAGPAFAIANFMIQSIIGQRASASLSVATVPRFAILINQRLRFGNFGSLSGLNFRIGSFAPGVCSCCSWKMSVPSSSTPGNCFAVPI